MRRFKRTLALLLLGLALAPGVGAADMDAALRHTEEGDEALEAEDYVEAAARYRKALAAASACLPARFGLGEALLEVGDTKGAVLAFRQVLRDAALATGIPVAWKRFAKEARKLLAQHDTNGRELEAMIDDHVADVMKLALKSRTKDPDLSNRALQIVLALRDDHKRARELLGQSAAKGARKEEIFDGKQIADWDGGRGQWWDVVDGVIVGDTKGVATYIRNQKEIAGNFDVLMEARITKAYDSAPYIALMASWKADYDHTRLGTLSGALSWYEYKGEEDKEQVFRVEADRLAKPYDPSEWTRYELRYREEWIHALVNGREVHKIRRPEERTGGYVGVLSQGCRAEVRRLDVLHR